jgi:thiol-disulfide isomerase/thioredoxin
MAARRFFPGLNTRSLRARALSLTALCAITACAGSETGSKPLERRVDAVAPAKVDAAKVAGFCEQHATAQDAKPFSWPKLDGAAPTPASGWRWVSVWATWCGPCIAEMPQLLKWKQKLADSGQPVDLSFVSADDSPAVVRAWQAKHPELPMGDLRIATKDELAPWLTTLGLDPSVAIPLHVFIDPQGRTRCVRTGAIDQGDFELVRGVLSGL